MKKLLSFAIGSVALAAVAAPQMTVERSSGVYKCNEKIVFNINVPLKPAALFRVRSASGVKMAPPAKLTATPITETRNAPGFVLTEFYPDGAKGKAHFAGAAIEPEKIMPGRDMPADFESYWQKELAQLRALPLSVETRELPPGSVPKDLKAFDVKIKRGDIVATGYLVMPANAAEKSLPVVATFLGASKVNAELPPAIKYARMGSAAFCLNFQGFDNILKPAKAQLAERRKQLPKWEFRKADKLDEFKVRFAFLRVIMTMDYLKTLPEWDGKRMAVSGGSFGGAQALVAAALFPEVGFCVSTATAMCDHYAADAGRTPGWPNICVRYGRQLPEVAYFDAVNFARLVKCPTVMAVGFIDRICPPASTYAAYNVLGTKDKKMYHVVYGDHGGNLIKGQSGVFGFGNTELRAFLQKK